jgi:hypothetical protein
MEAVAEWVEARPVAVHSITLKQISESTQAAPRRTPDRRGIPDAIGRLVDPVRRLFRFLGRSQRMSNENMARRCPYLSGSFQPKTM